MEWESWLTWRQAERFHEMDEGCQQGNWASGMHARWWWWWCGDSVNNPDLSPRACFVVGGYPTCSSPSREYRNSNRGNWEMCVHTFSCYIQIRTHTGDPDTLSCSSSPCWWTYSCWVPIEYLLVCWVLTSEFYVHPFPPLPCLPILPSHSYSCPSQWECDLWASSRNILSRSWQLVHNCSLHLWGLPPVLLPVDAGRVLPHKLEKLCVATILLLSHSSVCVCVCVCMCVFCLLYMCMLLTCYAFRCQFSWHEPPEETYSDVNIFGLQTMYVVVSTCTSE